MTAVFKHISKHLKVHRKYSAAHRIFNFLGVRKSRQRRSFMFNILIPITLAFDQFKQTELHSYCTFHVDTKFSCSETVMKFHEFSISSVYHAF